MESAALPINEAKDERFHRFVIQKHQASHLHYDWRLEMQGVLCWWAVQKGPATKLREARLAMHVEGHPLEYADFEGTIPPGNYGAGSVMLWDRGEYEDFTGNPAAAFHSGKLHIIMRGTKLRGEWILVKDRQEEDSNKWLLGGFLRKWGNWVWRRVWRELLASAMVLLTNQGSDPEPGLNIAPIASRNFCHRRVHPWFARFRWGESLTLENIQECRWVKPKLVYRHGWSTC